VHDRTDLDQAAAVIASYLRRNARYGNGNCGSPAAVTAGILTSEPLFIRIFRAHYFLCLIYLAVTATSLSCVAQTVLRYQLKY
jgi:hypothetical protein